MLVQFVEVVHPGENVFREDLQIGLKWRGFVPMKVLSQDWLPAAK
jgi:hypothetical protein